MGLTIFCCCQIISSAFFQKVVYFLHPVCSSPYVMLFISRKQQKIPASQNALPLQKSANVSVHLLGLIGVGVMARIGNNL